MNQLPKSGIIAVEVIDMIIDNNVNATLISIDWPLTIVSVIAIYICVNLLIRRIKLWYWKVEEIIRLLRSIDDKLTYLCSEDKET